MTRRASTAAVLAILALVPHAASAQTPASTEPPASPQPPASVPPPPAPSSAASPVDGSLPFASYVARVGEVHVESLAQRAGLPIAKAQIAVAQIFPNPTVTLGLAQVDISHQGAPTSSFVGVTVPLELGGKRRHRIAVAEANRNVVDAEIAAFLLGLRAEAAIAYVDALEARLSLERQQVTRASLDRLVAVNQHRFETGDVGETVLLQSQVEAESFAARIHTAEGRLRGAEDALAIYASADPENPTEVHVQGTLEIAPRTFDEAAMIAQALEARPDLLVRTRTLERAREQLALAYANRVIDAQLNVGWTLNGHTNVEQFRQNRNSTLGVTLTLMLPFANLYHGTTMAAERAIRQETLLTAATQLRVRAEVRRALDEYRAAAERVQVYGTGLLSRADLVLERTLYEYQHGGTTLIEVLVAQRTANQVHLDYYEALAEHARALIRLETAVGFWDVTFGP